MNQTTSTVQTEHIDLSLLDLDLKDNSDILDLLLNSQQQAMLAVRKARPELDSAINASAARLHSGRGRLVLAGAGASGRIAVQDGAELWPTFSWPNERLLCVMAGGSEALTHSVEGVEDDSALASQQVKHHVIDKNDVVICLAASGKSPWTCQWLKSSVAAGALGIGIASNADTPLLRASNISVLLDTGPEVLAGSTRMAAGTAQKIALNLFSTTLMIRMNRTYGNLMVDMGAVNTKLDIRRIQLLQGVLPEVDDKFAKQCIERADGWVKLAVLIAKGDTVHQGKLRLSRFNGSLRSALHSLSDNLRNSDL